MKISDLDSRVIIEYGRRNGNDIDRVVILENGVEPAPYSPSWPEDSWETTVQEFGQFLIDRHPTATEPLLKGKVITGDKEWFYGLQKQLLEERIPIGAIDALGNWSLWNIEAVDSFLAQYCESNDLRYLVMALGNTSYAISCSLFSRYYKQHQNGAVILEIILEAFPSQRTIFNEVRAICKQTQTALFQGGPKPNIEVVDGLVEMVSLAVIDTLSS